jgi:hypothetical protein
VVVLIFSVSVSNTAAIAAGTGTFVLFSLLWLVLPLLARRQAADRSK